MRYNIICPCCQETDWTISEYQRRPAKIDLYETDVYREDVPNRQYTERDYDTTLQERICNSCIYWMELVGRADRETSIRIGGYQFTIDLTSFDAPRYEQANEGRIFKIRHIETGAIKHVRLWSNAKIPEWAKEYLPDNYEWL